MEDLRSAGDRELYETSSDANDRPLARGCGNVSIHVAQCSLWNRQGAAAYYFGSSSELLQSKVVIPPAVVAAA